MCILKSYEWIDDHPLFLEYINQVLTIAQMTTWNSIIYIYIHVTYTYVNPYSATATGYL